MNENEIIPRYEFRAFAQNFGIVEERIRALSPVENLRESLDTYIISADTDENNTKIRYGQMDIKVFVEERRGLEQWKPRMKAEFPLAVDLIREEVFPAWGVRLPKFQRSSYTKTQFLEEIIWPHPALYIAEVYKLRFSFTVNDCITEIAHLLVNGASIRTVAVESPNVEAVLKARHMVRLEEYANTNYLVAIKRIMGLRKAEG
ncbi:MAG: hypothetical protein ACP5GX_07750 [Anaerolineae bacterium]